MIEYGCGMIEYGCGMIEYGCGMMGYFIRNIILSPACRASQPLETRPKVVDAEFEISQRFLPRRPVSSDRRDDQDGDDDDDGDDDGDVDGGEGDRDLEMLERALFKSERSAKFPEEPNPLDRSRLFPPFLILKR